MSTTAISSKDNTMTSVRDISPEEEQNLYQLVYLSSSEGQYSKQDLISILEVSRRNNTRDGVTGKTHDTTLSNYSGLLLYHDGNIIQFLEGHEDVVKNIYDRIALDKRHKGVLPLLRRRVAKRDFGNWSMGFREIDNDDKNKLDGFNDLMNSLSPHSVADPTMSKEVQRLIRSYRQVFPESTVDRKYGTLL